MNGKRAKQLRQLTQKDKKFYKKLKKEFNKLTTIDKQQIS